MTYSNATGSYQNDFLEPILDTEYKYDVPYKVDKDKYGEVLKKHNNVQLIKDADVLTFRCDCYGDDEDGYSWVFFAWPENSPEGSKDHYECVQFLRLNYKDTKGNFDAFVRDILECVIGPDKEHIKNLIDELAGEIEEKQKNIATLSDIIL